MARSIARGEAVSENPYAPPSAELGSQTGGRVLEGRGDFDIGQCLSEAWTNTWASFPLWLGAGVVWLVATLLAAVTIVGLLLVPVLAWGATWFVLRMHDGEAEFGDVFAGFSRFGRVFAPMLALSVVIFALTLVAQAVQIAGLYSGSDLLYGVGYLISLAFGLLITPRLMFAYFFLVDRDLSATEALSRAWSETSAAKWKVALLFILSQIVIVVGLAALLVGAIPATVMSYLMFVSAYRQIAGRPAPA